MPNQCLYNKLIIDCPWQLSQGCDSPEFERLRQKTQLKVSPVQETTHHKTQPVDYTILSLTQWQSDHPKCESSALIVQGSEEVETIRTAIEASKQTPGLIFIEFPVFSDGRGYSLAQLLKQTNWLKSDLGAIGDILQDQVYFYWRCGFDVILPRFDQDIKACKAALQSFSHWYQPVSIEQTTA